jgi:hypothetical protein
MTPEEYRQLDGLALAELVRKGEVTAQEVLAVAIALAEQHNPVLNAIVTPMYDEARQVAEKVPDGPFTGELLCRVGSDMRGRGHEAPRSGSGSQASDQARSGWVTRPDVSGC